MCLTRTLSRYRRIVAIEIGIWRSVRIGGAWGSVQSAHLGDADACLGGGG